MTVLRNRMIEDMKIRNLALNTQAPYLLQVSLFARYLGKSPALLGREDIRAYQLYLTQEKKLSPIPSPGMLDSGAQLYSWGAPAPTAIAAHPDPRDPKHDDYP